MLFGYGENKSSYLAFQYTCNRYYHNTYLHIMMIGGLVKLAFFVIILIYVLVTIGKLCRLDRQAGYMCFATVAAYLVYATIESVILFDTPVIAMLATVFVVSIPHLFLNAAERRMEEKNED